MQIVLKEKGFDVGKADGVLGARTRSALIAFQREQGLEPTGDIDQPTITALDMSNQAGSTTSGETRGAGTREATDAKGVPKLNVQPTCEAAAGGIIGLKQDIQTCLQSEQGVRDQLVKQWSQFRSDDRASCTRLTTMSGGGTYTELITCLEMKRDARKLPNEATTGAMTR